MLRVCEVSSDGWCNRHKSFHHGDVLATALAETLEADKERNRWDRILAEYEGKRARHIDLQKQIQVKIGKPRVSINYLAERRRRCKKSKDQGLPCTEFNEAEVQHLKDNPRSLRWAYGLTTVPSRAHDLLPRTLASLCGAGFESPRLFVDGCDETQNWRKRFSITGGHWADLEVTTRYPKVRTYGNWILALAEIYIRDPTADRFAIFQDDFVTYPNLRQYLERCAYPAKGYWNLYTFPQNQSLAPKETDGSKREGWYLSNQWGKGAVALVFNNDTVRELLFSQYMIERPLDPKRGWLAVDGGVVSALKKVGYKEYVHNPSLVQHTGLQSSMGNKRHELAISFRGERFDALTLLAGAEQPIE